MTRVSYEKDHSWRLPEFLTKSFCMRDTVPGLFTKRFSTIYRVGLAHVVFGGCSGPLSSKSANPKSSGQLDLLTCLPPIERRCVVVKYLVW